MPLRLLAFTIIHLLCVPLMAQVVQQPVVQQFSADTVVSVPDRGSIRIGGVNSASSARNSAGPFRSGTSTGFDRSASQATATVWIHDFAAMDRALLEEAARKQAGRADLQSQSSSPSKPALTAKEVLLRHRAMQQLDARWALRR